MNRANLFAMLFAMLSAMALGCSRSDRPETGLVQGMVTVDGEAVHEGSIRFIPTDGRPAMGEIVDGRYELRTYGQREIDGALVGNHAVTITAMNIKKKKGAPKPPDGLSQEELQSWEAENEGALFSTEVEWFVPERYSTQQTSDLTATVEFGENTIDFPLASASKTNSRRRAPCGRRV